MIPLISIFGATGTGKSSLSLDVAEKLRSSGRASEIINADAMQLYRGMNIGTAKLPPAQRRGIPHHQLDVLAVTEEASVAAYQHHARQTINAIIERGATPILVGGSGLYVSSVIYDFHFPGTDPEVRNTLENELHEKGVDVLYERLANLDPVSARTVNPRNGRRIIRALEVFILTGQSATTVLPDQPKFWRPTTLIGLTHNPTHLDQQLNQRVHTMWETGMLDETRELITQGIEQGKTAQKAIGYSQALRELRGEITHEHAVTETQQLTRRYARRQTGWFKRYAATTWIPATTETPEKLRRICDAPVIQ